MTAVTLVPVTRWLCRGVGKSCGYNIRARVTGQLWCCYVVVVLFPATHRFGLLFGNHIVDASSLVSFYQPLVANAFEVRLRGGVWCKLSAY